MKNGRGIAHLVTGDIFMNLYGLLDDLDLTNWFMIPSALDGSGPAKPNGKTLILYEGLEQSPGG